MYRPASVRVASLRPACPSRRSVSWLPWRHAVAARLDGPAMLGFVQARREVRTRSGRPGPLIGWRQLSSSTDQPRRMRAPRPRSLGY